MSSYPRLPSDMIRFPSAEPIDRPAQIDLCTLRSSAVYRIDGVDVLTYQADAPETGWATSAVISVTFSNNGRQWYQHPTVGSLTISAAALSTLKDVGGYRFVKFEVTTVGSGTSPLYAEISLCGRARPIVGTI